MFSDAPLDPRRTPGPHNSPFHQERAKNGLLPSGKSFSRFQLTISDEDIVRELRCIEWRAKTEFPVAKVLFYKALNKKRSDENYTVKIAFENYPLTLLDLPKMPLLQLIYLLREALIGFERLFDRLGGFVVSARMIKINKARRCKVWCHEDVTRNDPLTANAMTSRQFKDQILSIFEEKSLKSVLSKDIFEGLRTSKSIIEGIYFLKKISNEKSIKVPHKLMLLPSHLNREQEIPVTSQGLSKCCSVQAYKSGYQISESDGSLIAVRSGVKRKTSDISFFSRLPAENKFASEKSQDITKNSTTSKTILKTKASIETTLTCRETEEGRQPAVTEVKPKKQFVVIKEGKDLLKFRKMSYQGTANFRRIAEGKKGQIEQKIRKHSDNVMIKKKSIESPKQPDSPSSPEDRSETLMRVEQSLETPQYQVIIRYTQRKEKDIGILEQNGWLNRISSLTRKQFRDTVFSQQEGSDVLAEHILAHNMQILNNIGRQTKGSILLHSFEL